MNQSGSTAGVSPLADFLKRCQRRRRYSRWRLGHPLTRRLFGLVVPRRLVTRHRSGLLLALDRRYGNQDTLFWLDGDVEIQLLWAIRTLVPVGGLFVDCGANIGLMGLLARQYRGARVIFVEPHPRLAASVRENVRQNHWQADCRIIEAAASDSGGESEFFENQELDGSHSLHADWDSGPKRTLGKVRLSTLASVVEAEGVAHIDFLKVDTEGHDLAALSGLGPWLTPGRTPLVYVEMGRDARAIAQLMEGRGYIGFSLLGGSRRDFVRRWIDFERGAGTAFFGPRKDDAGDTLWCGNGSPIAAFIAAHARQWGGTP